MIRALCLALLLPTVALAQGAATRLALVVGNDVGDAGDITLPPLRHAERDARALAEHLVRYGQFPADQVAVVTGGTRADVLVAAQRLAERHRAVRGDLGADLPTLFTFFFTGHGLRGALLTADGALTGDDLARVFRDVGATVTFGLFDACHSGAFDLDTLTAKGIVPTPGFNPATALPEEVLTSRGTLWLTSSRPDEVSYEDPRVGSLFTHYFVEAFTRAPRTGPGVALEAMWQYARARTIEHAARFGRSQTPIKRVRRLESAGPLYLSFPGARDATVVFDPSASGTFLLRSAGGALVERVRKAAGRGLAVPVHPGRLLIGPLDGPPTWTVQVARGQRLVLTEAGRRPPGGGPGQRGARVTPMGATRGHALFAWTRAPTWHLAARDTFAPGPVGGLSAPHRPGLAVRRVSGPWTMGARAAVGLGEATFPTWSAQVVAPGVGLEAAWAPWRRGVRRLDLVGLAELDWLRVDYGGAAPTRSVWTPGAMLGARGQAQLGLTWALEIGVALRWTEGLAAGDTERRLHLGPAVAVEAAWPP